jgi:hypothetical protein
MVVAAYHRFVRDMVKIPVLGHWQSQPFRRWFALTYVSRVGCRLQADLS